MDVFKWSGGWNFQNTMVGNYFHLGLWPKDPESFCEKKLLPKCVQNGTGASLDPIIDIEMFEAPIALQSSYIKLPNRHCGKLEQPSRPL